MAEGRNLIAIRHGSNLSQAFEEGKRPIENFELGFDVENGVLYIGVNNTYQAVGANFGQDVVLPPKHGGLGRSIDIEGNQIGFSYFNKNGGQVIFAEGAGTVYLTTEKDEEGNIVSINVSHGILPPAAGGTGLSEILPNSFIYGGEDGNLVSIAPGKNTEANPDFNAGVPIFEINNVKTGIVPLEFGGTGEDFINPDIDLGLFYLTSIEENDVAKRVFRTLTNPTDDYSLLSFTDKLEWLQPPFIQKSPESSSVSDGGLMVYSGSDKGKDYFTTISGSGFLYSDSSGFDFKSIEAKDLGTILDSYIDSDELEEYVSGELDGYQPKIGTEGILVGTGEAISGVSGSSADTYLSYNGKSYEFVPIETGPKISDTGLLYGVSGTDTPDQVEINGASFPEKNSLVAIESSEITYLETLPLNYYNIPLKAADVEAIGDGDVWGILWNKYNKTGEQVELKELSSWVPQDGKVTKFFGLGSDDNFYWSSSLPTTTQVLPSNLNYAESGTASHIIGIVDGTDHFIKVNPSTFGKTYEPGFGISIEEGTISVDISGNSGVLWYWDNALRSYPINDKNDETSNLYLAAYDENKYMYRYNTGDGIVTLNNGIITLVSKEDIGGSDIVIGDGDGYLWQDSNGIVPTKNISGVTIGHKDYPSTFDTRYVTLAEVGTAGTSSKLLFMNSDKIIVSSSETIGDMPTITLPSGTQGGWVWMDEDGNLESRSIEAFNDLSRKGLLFTDSNDKLLKFYGTGTAGYLYTDKDGNISVSTPSSGGASYSFSSPLEEENGEVSIDLSGYQPKITFNNNSSGWVWYTGTKWYLYTNLEETSLVDSKISNSTISNSTTLQNPKFSDLTNSAIGSNKWVWYNPSTGKFGYAP